MLQKSDVGDSRSLSDQFHGAARDPTRPPSGADSDWTIAQNWIEFTAEEHETWDFLFERQSKLLQSRSTKAFLDGLSVLNLSRPGIPDFAELNERLMRLTGWEVVAVPGLVPDEVFFEHLSKGRFPAGNFIRSADSLDYIAEPDVFHDVFGHVPLLANSRFAQVMRKLGELGLSAIASGELTKLGRLYWHVVEFGLIEEEGSLRILGAGLASSFGESQYSLESDAPVREPFSLEAALETPYKSDEFQQHYFVVKDFAELLQMLSKLSW